MNSSIKKSATLFFILFFILLMTTTYISVFQPQLNSNTNNTIPALDSLRTPRGSIISSDNEVLAESVKQEKIYRRNYPLGKDSSHVVGYSSVKYGRYGAESYFNNYLTSGSIKKQLPLRLADSFTKNQIFNTDIVLTINSRLQKAAALALKGRRGAIIAMNPKDGSILAAYSFPDFDPNNFDENWKQLIDDARKPLIFRATQGLYPPGSLMKIITMSAALKTGISNNSTWPGPSSVIIGGGKVTNFKDQSSGEMSMANALIKSSNTVFGQIAVKVGKYPFFTQSEEFGFNETPDFDFAASKSRLPSESEMDELELAWSAVGQGRVLSTPLEMALMASAIANNGNIQVPHLLKEARQLNGNLVYNFKNKVWLNPLDEQQADIIKNAMIGVVEKGTGTAAAIDGVKVAGKTGTAEVEIGSKPHAWFVGFAPADDPEIVVAVIVENGGLGGKVAAPIAQEIIDKALSLDIGSE